MIPATHQLDYCTPHRRQRSAPFLRLVFNLLAFVSLLIALFSYAVISDCIEKREASDWDLGGWVFLSVLSHCCMACWTILHIIERRRRAKRW